jgi:hypothetical protein
LPGKAVAKLKGSKIVDCGSKNPPLLHFLPQKTIENNTSLLLSAFLCDLGGLAVNLSEGVGAARPHRPTGVDLWDKGPCL